MDVLEQMIVGSLDRRTKALLVFDAQDEILSFAIQAAQSAEERGDIALSGAIMDQATKIAKRWKIEKPGLPGSFVQ